MTTFLFFAFGIGLWKLGKAYGRLCRQEHVLERGRGLRRCHPGHYMFSCDTRLPLERMLDEHLLLRAVTELKRLQAPEGP